MKHEWNGKPISSPADTEGLERSAARNQFTRGMDRGTSEERAYSDYKREQHAVAAAHHLSRAQHAISMGDRLSAEKHNAFYDMHVQTLGHRKSVVPPAEVRAHMGGNQAEMKSMGFRSHAADALLSS